MLAVAPTPERYVVDAHPQVERGLLEIVTSTRGLLRPEAAEAFDTDLRRLAMGSHVLDLALGKVLAPIAAGGYADTGHASMRDYCAEELGVSATFVRDLVRRHKALEQRTVLREALLHGRVLATQIDRLLQRALDEQQDACWVEIAAGKTNRGFRIALEEGLPQVAAPAPERKDVCRIWTLPADFYVDFLSHVVFCSMVAGRDLEVEEVLEPLVAEYLAAAPLAPAAEPGEMLPPDAPGPSDRHAWKERVYQDLEEITRAWEFLSQAPVQAELSDELTQAPEGRHEVHVYARKLLLVKHRLGLHIGRMLRTFKWARLYRDCGFLDIYHYARERLGMERSTVAALVARDAKLIAYADVYEAVYDGRLTLCQADLVMKCAEPQHSGPWIEYARHWTVRRLKEVEKLFRVVNRLHEVRRARNDLPPQPGETLASIRQDVQRALEERKAQAREMAAEDLAEIAGGILRDSAFAAFDAQLEERLREFRTMDLENGERLDASVRARLQPGATWVDQSHLWHEVRQAEFPHHPRLKAMEHLLPYAEDAEDGEEFEEERWQRHRQSVQDFWLQDMPVLGADGRLLPLRLVPGGRVQTFSLDLPEPRPARFRTAWLMPTLELRTWHEPDEDAVLQQALDACRRAHGDHLTDSECLPILVARFRETWSPAQKTMAASRRRLFERFGWRCAVPGCTSRRNMQDDHVKARARGGGDELENRECLCQAHHLRHKHEERMRVRGVAPDDLTFEVGIVDGKPWAIYHGDEVLARAG